MMSLFSPDPVFASRRVASVGCPACASFYEILFSRRSICVAPVRGGSHFLCCCKESNQRNSYPQPKHFMPAAAQNFVRGSAVASALTGLTELGSRTVCHLAPHNKLVQQSFIRHRASRCRRALPVVRYQRA